ncbi:MAG: hypothetical protein QGG58_08245 [Chloroflexota bacterium]|nr:hypothetical protein [Chloroflexota bacterium]
MSEPAARQIEADDLLSAQQLYLENGWTDGLPIIPPTPALVERTLSFTKLDPGDVIGQIPERRRTITVEKVAINAVMAGCRPEYLPVVLAGVEAFSTPESNPHGPSASTGGSGLMLIVNGPPVTQLGFNSGANVFGPGPGAHANATVGRALRLVLLNCAGSVPGGTDRSTLGHPGKYSWCIAEDESDERWDPLHVVRDFAPAQGAVTTFWGLSTLQISDHVSPDPEGILASFAAQLHRPGMPRGGGCQVVVVVGGEHRETLAGAGLTKEDVRDGLFRLRPDATISEPEDILVVAAGGTGGRFSALTFSWGSGQRCLAATRPVEDCVNLVRSTDEGSD